jgi:hypothetical protein
MKGHTYEESPFRHTRGGEVKSILLLQDVFAVGSAFQFKPLERPILTVCVQGKEDGKRAAVSIYWRMGLTTVSALDTHSLKAMSYRSQWQFSVFKPKSTEVQGEVVVQFQH